MSLLYLSASCGTPNAFLMYAAYRRSSNSSTVSPAALIKCLNKPGFSSLCFGTDNVTLEIFFSEDNMTADLPVRYPAHFGKCLDCFHPGNYRKLGHQTTTSTILVEGLTMYCLISSSARDSRHACMASLMFSRASSTVSPCEAHPEILGQVTMYPPASSSFSKITLKCMIIFCQSMFKLFWFAA